MLTLSQAFQKMEFSRILNSFLHRQETKPGFPHYGMMLCIYGFLNISSQSQGIMHLGEVPEKMGERTLRLLILLPVGNATQTSHAISTGIKATGHSLVNGFLAVKSICIMFGPRKYIFCTLYFSLWFFSQRFNY